MITRYYYDDGRTFCIPSAWDIFTIDGTLYRRVDAQRFEIIKRSKS